MAPNDAEQLIILVFCHKKKLFPFGQVPDFVIVSQAQSALAHMLGRGIEIRESWRWAGRFRRPLWRGRQRLRPVSQLAVE